MFAHFVCSLLLGLASLSIVQVLAYYPQGYITAPANGTHIAPGASFPFTYNVRSDYCTSSYNYTVILVATPPGGNVFSNPPTGTYLGRFSAPGSSNPNPPPAQLKMPNYSLYPGGFGTGMAASNLQLWLTVVEEWRTCTPQIGNTFSVTANYITYNATS